MRGKINMICKQWCIEMYLIFATSVGHSWPFQRGSTVFSTWDLSTFNVNRV